MIFYQYISTTRQSNQMNFHQLFSSVDAACLGVDEDSRLDIIQAFLLSDYEEEEEANINLWSDISVKKRKKRGKAEYSYYNRCYSFLTWLC